MHFLMKFKNIFAILCYVRYWDSHKKFPFCGDFDEWINLKIKEGHIPKYKEGSDCLLEFAGRTLWNWKANIRTSSEFSLWEPGYDSVRPYRLTQIKLYNLLHMPKDKPGLKWRNGNE